MSDTEVIIKLLRNVERRIRANRLRQELTLGLSIVLVFLVAVKFWDLFSPFNAATITFILAGSSLLFIGYAVWRLQKKGTLGQAAVSIDRRAGLYDEIKTALWFIHNPRSSQWIERQIQRAAKNAVAIDVHRAYPSIIPRTVYIAAAMILLFVGLNFMPLPLNHNWLMLQAAPGLTRAEKEQAALDWNEELLRKVRGLHHGELNDAFDVEEIRKGLDEIARDLAESEELSDVAEAILEKELDIAAEEMRKVAGQMGTDTPSAAEKMLQSFQKAANNSRPGLEALAENLAELAEALENQDEAAVQEAVEKVAEELERIEGEMQVHETGGEQIARGVEARPGEDSSQVRQDGESPQARSDSMGPGASQSKDRGQLEAPATTLNAKLELDVKLQQAGLKGMRDESAPPPEDVEEASRRERSKLDYRNVKSELTAAQKDLLNQDYIPWEYRPLIRSYFQAIRPPMKKGDMGGPAGGPDVKQ